MIALLFALVAGVSLQTTCTTEECDDDDDDDVSLLQLRSSAGAQSESHDSIEEDELADDYFEAGNSEESKTEGAYEPPPLHWKQVAAKGAWFGDLSVPEGHLIEGQPYCQAENCIDMLPISENKRYQKGCRRGTTNCATASDGKDSPYLGVDMGTERTATRVTILNRQDKKEPQKDFGAHQIWISNTKTLADGRMVGQGVAEDNMGFISYDIDPSEGQYLFVLLPGANRKLQMAEVEFYEPVTPVSNWLGADFALTYWAKDSLKGTFGIGKSYAITVSNSDFAGEYMKAGTPVAMVAGDCRSGALVWGPEQIGSVIVSGRAGGSKFSNILFSSPSIWPPPWQKESLTWCVLLPRYIPTDPTDPTDGADGTDNGDGADSGDGTDGGGNTGFITDYILGHVESYNRMGQPDKREDGNKKIGAIGCCRDGPTDDSNPTEGCLGRGSDKICGTSYEELGLSRTRGTKGSFKSASFSWKQAKEICEQNDFRLCTLDELHANELSGIEPFNGQNADQIWTSTIADPCGNEKKAAYEPCDDGNLINGDGCNAYCFIEPEYKCVPCDDQKQDGKSCCFQVDALILTLSNEVERHRNELASLARSMVNAQTHVDELNRLTGNSGVYQARQYFDNIRANVWEKASYVSDRRGPCGVHNHADHITTIGMADCSVVLNGFHFRTRHNDYSIKKPASDDLTFNANVDIKWPDPPKSVTDKRTPEDEIIEMKKYYKAFMDQDDSETDYKPYFPALLCYMEGWLEYAEPGAAIEDPFSSERHSILSEASTWSELMQKERARLMAGEKSQLENGAYLPQLVVDVTDKGIPVKANFVYGLKCHEPKNSDGTPMDIPFQRMRPTSELSTKDLGRKELFEFDPLCSQAYDPKTPWSQNGSQKRTCKQILTSFTDELMEQIPGKDNYNAPPIGHGAYRDPKTNKETNAAMYNRVFRTDQKDANGEKNGMRGFHDPYLWVAETTNEKVVAFNGRRFSWAIPFEVIYLSPLRTWNPYGIKHYERKGSEKENQKGISGNGCPDAKPDDSEEELKKCAWSGIQHNNYFQTPASLFTDSADAEVDTADTGSSVNVVLDQNGKPRRVVASGVAISTKKLDGKSVRTRYPVFPLHEESLTVWHEMKLMQAMLQRKEGYGSKHSTFVERARQAFPFQEVEAASLVEQSYRFPLMADDHEHYLDVTEGQLNDVDMGNSVVLRTSPAADGHTHSVELASMPTQDASEHTLNAVEHPPVGGEVGISHVDGHAGTGGHTLGYEEPIIGEPVEAEEASREDKINKLGKEMDEKMQQIAAMKKELDLLSKTA